MKIKLIINPQAGFNSNSERNVAKIKELLGPGNELDIHLTEKRFDAFNVSREAAADGYDIIVGGGGDGTINQVINGVVHAGKPVPIGFLPMGTSNAYALSLGIPLDLSKACQVILGRNIKKIDLGRTNTSSGYHYFISMAGAGFDAQTVDSVNPAVRKVLGGIIAHLIAGVYSLLAFDRARLHVEVDGEKHEGYQIFIFNGKFYGGYIKAAPHADMTDGYLDVYLFKNGKKKDVVRYFSGVIGRFHLKFKDIDYFRAKNIKLEASDEVLIQLDGEIIGTLPREFEIYPEGINVVMP